LVFTAKSPSGAKPLARNASDPQVRHIGDLSHVMRE
jgi:hypothetical protein